MSKKLIESQFANYFEIYQALEQLKNELYSYFGEIGSDVLVKEISSKEFIPESYKYRNNVRWIWSSFKSKRSYLNKMGLGLIHRDYEFHGKPQAFLGIWFKKEKDAKYFFEKCDEFESLDNKGDHFNFKIEESQWKGGWLIWAEIDHEKGKDMLKLFDKAQLRKNLVFLANQVAFSLNEFEKLK